MNTFRLVDMKKWIISILFAVILVVAGLSMYMNVFVSKAYASEPVTQTEKSAEQMSSFTAFSLDLYHEIGLKESGLDSVVFQKALTGYYNLKNLGSLSAEKDLLTIVDFRKPSTEKRFWVIDLRNKTIKFNSLVAHGKNTGEQFATNFSNRPSSNMSSLGFYVTGEPYMGKHGLSLYIDGQDKGFNDNARDRSVVIHGADYVSEEFAQRIGRIGRSQGCPALPEEITPEVVSTLQGGTCLFIYYPDAKYEAKTQLLNQQLAEAQYKKEILLGMK
jgi:hypothetical protein